MNENPIIAQDGTLRMRLQAIYNQQRIRPEGYVADVLNHGKIQGDFLIITVEDYKALIARYSVVKTGAEMGKCRSCGGK